MQKTLSIISLLFFVALTLSSCRNASTNTNATDAMTSAADSTKKAKIDFNADSAYSYIKAQTDFGPRVPGSEASARCADWLASKLDAIGAKNINVQRAQVKAYTGKTLDIRNITASINPDAKKRVLLLSHWDSRPWADQDPNPELRSAPIDGANDGASGVGVILEIVRNLANNTPAIGVDVLFVDAEDYGRRDDDDNDAGEESWCLGTQYWAANPTLQLDNISYAVLLDMVGGKNATFPREHFSQQVASFVVDKVWRQAAKSGYADRFIDVVGTPVLDDHIYLLKANVPAIDIIENAHPDTGSFNPTWHTHNDNINNIDKTTLKAVGQTLTDLIYSEK